MIEIFGIKLSIEVVSAIAFIASELIGASNHKQNSVTAVIKDLLVAASKKHLRNQ
jgi:hypothetical protein